MNLLNNLNVSKKLTVGFAVVITVVVAMCAAVFLSLMSIKGAVAANDQSVRRLDLASQVLTARVERQNAIRGLVASGDPAFQQKAEAAAKTYQSAIAEWEKVAPEDAADLAKIKEAVATVEADETGLISAGLDPTRQAEAMLTLATKGRLEGLRATLKTTMDRQSALLKKRAAAQGCLLYTSDAADE